MMNQPKPVSKPNIKLNPETIRINRALGYSEAEIIANRKGVITEKQHTALTKNLILSFVKFGSALIVLLVLLTLGLTGNLDPFLEELFKFSTRLQSFKNLALIALVLGIIATVFALFGAVSAVFTLRKPKVVRYEGAVRKEVISQSGITSQYLHFHNTKREVPQQIFNLFQNGKHYVIYHLENYPSILSVEATDPSFNQ